MKIALIVANSPHLKTEQIALHLAAVGRNAITIVSVPFITRKPRNPIFQHRPDQYRSVALDELAVGLGLSIVHTNSIEEFDPETVDICLMTGGVILPPAFMERAEMRVLNCHPGLIPECRGLDAFKWAILTGQQVGNTLHFIDSRIDLGQILWRSPTPVFRSDTLATFARRHYEAEVRLLANFERYISIKPTDAASLSPIGPRYMRMKKEAESRIEAAFHAYKFQYALPEGKVR